jgi:hypothetical protein
MIPLLIEAVFVHPRGKAERLNVPVDNERLNREWVQIRNMTPDNLELDQVSLHHLVYQAGEAKESLVLRLTGTLPAMARMRIHSGSGTASYDDSRQLYHAYVNPKQKAFRYQIMKPETLLLRRNNKLVDRAGYDANQPMGIRLKRVEPAERGLLEPVPPEEEGRANGLRE